MLLCVKSMAISAISSCFWRVKCRKWNCIAISETHKQLCISEIQKLLMLGVFTLTRRVGCLHTKYEETRCQEKIHSLYPANTLLMLTCMKWVRGILTHLLNIHPIRIGSLLAEKKKAQEHIYCPWVLLVFTFSVNPYLHLQNSQTRGFNIRLR